MYVCMYVSCMQRKLTCIHDKRTMPLVDLASWKRFICCFGISGAQLLVPLSCPFFRSFLSSVILCFFLPFKGSFTCIFSITFFFYGNQWHCQNGNVTTCTVAKQWHTYKFHQCNDPQSSSCRTKKNTKMCKLWLHHVCRESWRAMTTGRCPSRPAPAMMWSSSVCANSPHRPRPLSSRYRSKLTMVRNIIIM